MKLMKRMLSLLLVVAMLSSFALVTSAEETQAPNLVLKAYRTDGTEIGANDHITVGEKFNVRVITTEEVKCSCIIVMVKYDPDVLQANAREGTYGEICYQFDNKAITAYNTFDRTEDTIPVGTPVAQLTLGAGEHNVTAPAGTTWCDFSFTALKDADATDLVTYMPADDFIILDENTWPMDPLVKEDKLVLGNLSLKIVPAPVAVESVTLNKTQLSLAYGGSEQLTATVAPDNADDKTVTWASANTAIATVENGLVTGVSEGTAQITATAGGKSATCDVYVAAEGVVPVTSITITTGTETTCAITSTRNIAITVTPSDATHVADVVWTSSDPSVATVARSNNTRAKVTPVSVGKTTITASVDGCSASIVVTITNPITAVNISTTSAQLAVGESLQLSASAIPSDTTETDKSVTWSSGNETVAKVDSNGKVTALAEGSVTITAKIGTKSATCKVTVIQLEDGTYTVSMPDDQNLTCGDTVSLPVSVGSSDEDVTTFNAFDMKFTYDSDMLELVTEKLDGCTLTSENGTVRVIRYGESMNLGNAFTLQFKAKEMTGKTSVTLTSALVGISDTALTENAKKATLTKAATELTLKKTFTVSLPDGVTSDQGTTVEQGADYTFKISDEDAEFWNYTVEATIDSDSKEVIDNEDGSYTVKNVTGPLTITVTKTGKPFTVSVTGSGNADVTYSENAAYGTDYKFTVNKDSKYSYEVTATISGETYDGLVGPDAEGQYTIAGKDIKGTIEITVNKTEIPAAKEYNVYVEGTGKDDVEAPEKATEGQDFTFTIKCEDGYIYELEVDINGQKYQKELTPVTSEDGKSLTYTIPKEDVTAYLILTVTKEKAFSVTWDNQCPDVIKQTYVKELSEAKKIGSDYVFRINGIMKAYKVSVTVKENGVAKDVTTETVDSSNTRESIKYTVAKVQGDLEITISYTIDTDVVKVAVTPFVELDDATVFMVATRVRAGITSASDRNALALDTYDGHGMYMVSNTTLYADKIEGSATEATRTCVWLVTVPKGESFTVEDAAKKLSYTNQQPPVTKPEGLYTTADVNRSGRIDVNDAQLAYDIYNGVYQKYCMTNQLNGTYEEEQIGATMTKFIQADVNKDMKVDALDAAAVINQIK